MAGKPTDELLAALPEVGLRLVCLGEHTGADRWGCMIAEAKFDPKADIWDGHGDTPAAALTMALRRAGIEVTDE